MAIVIGFGNDMFCRNLLAPTLKTLNNYFTNKFRKWSVLYKKSLNSLTKHIFLPWPRSEGSAATITHPFRWLLFLLFLLRIKRWREVKTSYNMNNIPRTPKISTDSEPSIKWLLEGLMRGALTPLTPPMGGGAKVFFWGLMTDQSDPHRVKYFWEALNLKYDFSFSWGVPRPPDP